MERKLRHRRKKGMWLGVFLLTAFMFLMTPFGQAFALVVDNFNGNQDFSIDSGTHDDTFSGAGIIGGERTVRLHYNSGPAPNSLNANTSPSGMGFNIFNFSEDSGVSGTCSVFWLNNYAPAFDLTDGGTQTSFFFRLRVQ